MAIRREFVHGLPFADTRNFEELIAPMPDLKIMRVMPLRLPASACCTAGWNR